MKSFFQKSSFLILTLLALVASFVLADYDYQYVQNCSASAGAFTFVSDDPHVPGAVVQHAIVSTSASYSGNGMQTYSMYGSVTTYYVGGGSDNQTLIDINSFFIGSGTDGDSTGLSTSMDPDNPWPMPGADSSSSCGAACAYAMD